VKDQDRKPIILCAGPNGRAVIFGLVTEDPVPGEPVTLRDARMVLRWEGGSGLFGLAANGPQPGSRITAPVESTTATVWREVIEVSPAAADAITGWPHA